MIVAAHEVKPTPQTKKPEEVKPPKGKEEEEDDSDPQTEDDFLEVRRWFSLVVRSNLPTDVDTRAPHEVRCD